MTPRSALARQVGFLLSELPSENAAHRFEDLCRQVSRERLVANLVPATGPVGAGGDQGRDFETYRTYLAQQLGRHGGFTVMVPNGAAAFACTLQQDDVPTKIRRDVRTVCQGGVEVESVYCFVIVTVPVGVRHRLQAARVGRQQRVGDLDHDVSGDIGRVGARGERPLDVDQPQSRFVGDGARRDGARVGEQQRLGG